MFVCKTNYTITFSIQVFRTHFVVFLLLHLGMVGSVHFNHQCFVGSQEIDNIVTYDVLSLELYAQGTFPYMLPQHLLCFRCTLPILTSKSSQ